MTIEKVLAAFYADLRRRHLRTVVVSVAVVVMVWIALLTVRTPRIEEHARQFKGVAVLILVWSIYLIVYLDLVKYRIKHGLFGKRNVEIEILRDFLSKYGRDFDIDTVPPGRIKPPGG